jgi:hypothetical protein
MKIPTEPADSPHGASKIANEEIRVSFLLCPGKAITNALPGQKKSGKSVFPTITMLMFWKVSIPHHNYANG